MTYTSKPYDQYRWSSFTFNNKTMASPPKSLSKTQKCNMRKRKRTNAAGKKLMAMKKKRTSANIVQHLQQIKDNGGVINQSDYDYVDHDIKRLIDGVFGATQQSTTVGLLADGAGNEEAATEEDAAAEREEVKEKEGGVAEPDERLATGDVVVEVAEPDERLATEVLVGADVVAEPDERLATGNDDGPTDEGQDGEDEVAEVEDGGDEEEKDYEEEDEVAEHEDDLDGGDEEYKEYEEDTVDSADVEETDVLHHPRIGLIELPSAELDFDEGGATPEDVSSEDSPDWGFLEEAYWLPFQLAPHEAFNSHGIRKLWDVGVVCSQFTIDERIVRCFSNVEKLLSRSSYTGHARPVRYAPFTYFVEPFMQTKVWGRWTDMERKGF